MSPHPDPGAIIFLVALAIVGIAHAILCPYDGPPEDPLPDEDDDTRRSTMTATYAELKEQMAALRAAMQDKAKEWFKEHSAALFAAHPTLEAFAWHQYTPYFNDGSECVFGANTDMDSLILDFTTDGPGDRDDRWERPYLVFENLWGTPRTVKPGKEAEAAAYEAVHTFLGAFTDEDMKEMFGDHVEVTVRRDGVTTARYDHD